MAGVADGSVKSEELLERIGNVEGREEVVDGKESGLCVNEVNARIVAEDADVAIRVGEEAAGEGEEVGKSDRK